MPPRRIKKDPEAVKVAKALQDSLDVMLGPLEKELEASAKLTAKQQAERILAMIPDKYKDMTIMQFLAEPPVDIFDALKIAEKEKEEESETEIEKENVKDKTEDREDVDMDIDDAAHETSIPIAPSRQNSGRNTAVDSQRNFVTPAGQSLPVPTLHPFKPFRTVYDHEKFAFSVNGSPLVLPGAAVNKKKSTKKSNTRKKTPVDTGLRVPKEEDVGTSV